MSGPSNGPDARVPPVPGLQGMKLPADCVLIAGQVTVNEAMLTGEATVVPKQAAVPGAAPTAAEPRNTLFGGSIVVQLRVRADVAAAAGVRAVVVRTGFESVKGRLVLSILYPRAGAISSHAHLILLDVYSSVFFAAHFEFMRQAVVFVLLLAVLALVGFAVNVKALIDACAGILKIILRGCDMVRGHRMGVASGSTCAALLFGACSQVTIVVPPSLPLALTVGVTYALVALRRHLIFCISPPRINLAGKASRQFSLHVGTYYPRCIFPQQINCFCFDKTGTLTSEGLELACLRPVVDTGAGSRSFTSDDVTERASLPTRFAALLASCHALTHVGDALTGDPLEVKTFAFSGAALDEPHHPSPTASGLPWTELPDFVSRVVIPGEWRGTVLHQFDFVPALQRMGVLVAEEGAGVLSFVKGSPEAIAALCDPATLPSDFWSVLASYTHQGYRVLGAGWKRVSSAMLPPHGSPAWAAPELRDAAEAGLEFIGLIVLENQLKPASRSAISALRAQGGLALAMITGDNAEAAVCVGRKCELVEPGFRVYIGDLAPTTAPDLLASPRAADNAEDESLMADLVSSDTVAVGISPCTPSDGPHEIAAPKATTHRTPLPSPQAAVTWTDVDDSSRTLDPLLLTPMAEVPRGECAANPEPYRLALTGRAFAVLHDAHRRGADAHGVFRRAILNGAVFARMSPEAKATLVEEYQATGLYVGMVGDGANDSLALRSAHVGISLSQVWEAGRVERFDR